MNPAFMRAMTDNNQDSSDEEVNTQAPKRKLSKKEQRKETQFQRDSHGVETGKESTKRSNERGRRGNYRGGRGRDKDRQSGTGRQAFGNNNFKKGGHGKGNVGNAEEGENVELTNNQLEEVKEEAPVEPEVKVKDLDDYMKENNMTLKLKDDKQEEELMDPKMFEDETTVALPHKKKNNKGGQKKDKGNSYVMGGTALTDSKGGYRKKRTQKGKKPKKLNDEDFPALE